MIFSLLEIQETKDKTKQERNNTINPEGGAFCKQLVQFYDMSLSEKRTCQAKRDLRGSNQRLCRVLNCTLVCRSQHKGHFESNEGIWAES